MQVPNVRHLVLIAILLAGGGLYAGLGEPHGVVGAPRWPNLDSMSAGPTWSIGSDTVAGSNNTNLVTQEYRSLSGGTATLTLVASQMPKLYAAGAEVPFLGSGYAVESAPGDVVPPMAEGVNALIAHQGTERWLVMYAYGERRGLLGNGARAWSLALFDGLLAHPNDYYKLYLVARTDRLDPNFARAVAELAGVVFPRIAAWYAV